MNIKWDGKGNFEGDFTPEQRKEVEDRQAKQPHPHITDLFKLMDDGADPYDNVEREIPLTCDCSRCDNILEAPLLKGSKQCCVDSLKQMLYDWMEDNKKVLLLDGDLDMLKWAVWLQKWVELNNKESEPLPVMRIVDIEESLEEFKNYLNLVQEEDDNAEEKKTDFDADRK